MTDALVVFTPSGKRGRFPVGTPLLQAARTLGVGGFATMPSKAKHRFSCQSKTTCVMFVTFDSKYDIFWVKENKTK